MPALEASPRGGLEGASVPARELYTPLPIGGGVGGEAPLTLEQAIGGGAPLTLEQAIRLAQDSAIAAFESRYENDYHRLHYGEFMALRKPQLNLRVSPNYYKVIADLSSDYVDFDNYNNFSAAASVKLSQKMLNWGGEAYVGMKAIWTEYLSSNKTFARQFMAAPILVGYRQTLLGYNPYRWEKVVEDQRLKAARQQHEYNMNTIAEEAARRYFRWICSLGELEMYRRNVEVTDTLYAIAREKATIAMVTVAELRSLELDCMNAANLLAIARTNEEVARTRLASYLRISSDSFIAPLPSIGAGPVPARELYTPLPFFPQAPFPLPEELYTPLSNRRGVGGEAVGGEALGGEAITRAMDNSPVLQQQIAQITESRHQEQKARKEKGLNMALDVNVGMQQVDQKLGEAFRDQRFYALASVTLTVPLMDHGAAKKRHAAAQAWVEREESALEEAERALREEVTTTLQDISTYYRLLESTRKAINEADEVFEMITDNYANGLCDINTYALAERRRADAYQHYLLSVEKYWTTYYHLKTLIGN